MKVVGIDVGSTFTDIIVLDIETGISKIHKLPSTPGSQDIAVVEGIKEVLSREKVHPDEINLIVHGTTVATNAMLERKGARTCLIATKGTEDVLEIGRQNRTEIYDFLARKPEPLVPRNLRFGIKERLDSTGSVIQELSNEDVDKIIESLRKQKPEAVAISLLFSFLNPNHEKKILKSLNDEFDSYVVASSDILPEFREFERTSTTVLEAYLGPLVVGYLENLQRTLSNYCRNAQVTVMQSNGGTMLCSMAEGHAVGLAISGLAGGVIGGWYVAEREEVHNAITFDMGGTSCDISALSGGIVVRPDNEIGGLPLRIPSVDVKTIGAGGGSIAWIDDVGILHVGPQSAGAIPGPAAYSQGGDEATVTDANLVLGRLNPEYFVGGRLKLDYGLAEKSIKRIGSNLSLNLDETALGIIRISTSNMVQAIREVTVERGRDPREFVLIPFGGAGPTQAVDIAEQLDIDSILIPKHPGITSALGLVCADLRVDSMLSIIEKATQSHETMTVDVLQNLVEENTQRLLDQGCKGGTISHELWIDMRYVGQSHEIAVPIKDISNGIMKSLMAFENQHEKAYGYHLENKEIEWVTARVVSKSSQARVQREEHALKSEDKMNSWREIVLDSRERLEVPVYRRDEFVVDTEIDGPLIIEQIDTTTYVSPGWKVMENKRGRIWVRRLSHD